MLFGYPKEAAKETWFHECVVVMLQAIHESIRNGQEPPAWPAIIPLEHRNDLRRKTGLRDRLKKYQDTIALLTADEAIKVLKALVEQNDIEHLLSGECECNAIDELPEIIWEPIQSLFEYGFNLLGALGIRDRQYEIIFDATPFHVCPFCGVEYFDDPAAPREPLDHYLPRSRYPFAAINPRNLIPMGGKCNSKYKLAKDILFADDGTRRKVADPYNWGSTNISLVDSVPFEGTREIFPLPLWQIEFEPDVDELSTWDSVFDIKQRYRRDVLDADFMSMLREFSIYCKDRKVKIKSPKDIVDALENFSEYWKESGMKDKAFMKAAVFDMLCHHCKQGNDRLIELISGVVIGGMSLNA